MTTIIAGQLAKFTVSVQADGAPVAIDPASTVSAQIFSMNGLQSLTQSAACESADAGANWLAGVVAVSFDSTATEPLTTGSVLLVLTSSNPGLVKRFKLDVETADAPTRSDLFIKDLIIEDLRADGLMIAAQNFFAGVTLTDDFLWGKIKAAESEIKHTLRVPLVPTQFFPYPPTSDQIAALPAGMPYAVDPPYDYGPSFFDGDSWGYLATRQKPVRDVQVMRFTYPDPSAMVFVIPTEWIRLDQKYGVIRLVPSTYAVTVPLSSFLMQVMSTGRTIPFMLELTYVAGIENAWVDYPELIDVIKKTAVLKTIQDGFLPQSGSISADGLSQSVSVDMEKYGDMIDVILNGPKGSNGGLMTAIHGIRAAVFGGY